MGSPKYKILEFSVESDNLPGEPKDGVRYFFNKMIRCKQYEYR